MENKSLKTIYCQIIILTFQKTIKWRHNKVQHKTEFRQSAQRTNWTWRARLWSWCWQQVLQGVLLRGQRDPDFCQGVLFQTGETLRWPIGVGGDVRGFGLCFFGRTVVMDTEQQLDHAALSRSGASGLCVRMVVIVQTLWSTCFVVGADHNIDWKWSSDSNPDSTPGGFRDLFPQTTNGPFQFIDGTLMLVCKKTTVFWNIWQKT